MKRDFFVAVCFEDVYFEGGLFGGGGQALEREEGWLGGEDNFSSFWLGKQGCSAIWFYPGPSPSYID